MFSIKQITVIIVLGACMVSLMGLGFTCEDLRSEEEQALTNISLPPDEAGAEASDSDGDGLTDREEQSLGTNHLKVDTDNDGINDKEEADGVTDPTDSDTDNDGLTDSEEREYNTDPENGDMTSLSNRF